MDFSDVRKTVSELKSRKQRFIMCIDGNCAGGKTTLAAYLKEECDIETVHMDHFYLPFDRRIEGWKEIDGGNMDFAKLNEKVIVPYLNKEKISFEHYDPHTDSIVEEFDIDIEKPLCIEGTYSAHRDLGNVYDLRIFVRCDEKTQLERLMIRQGGDISGFVNIWIPMENRYFSSQSVEESCGLVVDTSVL